MDSMKIMAKIKSKTREYREFCRACGVPEATTKMRYECGTADLTKTDSWKQYAALKQASETDASREGRRKRSPKEIQEELEGIRKEITSYTSRTSKWSGKIIVDNKRCEEDNCVDAKEWNCDILIRDDTDTGTSWHEMLHSCSISHYTPKDYAKYSATEEAAVELLTQEICAQKGIFHAGAYPNYVTVLRATNRKMHFADDDLEFAKDFFSVEPPDRFTWLHDKVSTYLLDNGASVDDMNEVIDFIAILEDIEI